jgi:hypothetical protein
MAIFFSRMPADSRKAFAYGVGGSLLLVLVWGLVIAGAPEGGLIEPVAEALVTMVVLVLSGLGCLIIGVQQLLNAKTRHLGLWSLIYGTFPFITMTVIFWYMGAVRNLEFA